VNTDTADARREALSPEPPVRPIARETTDRGGIIRLEYWPDDGYVLWYHGRIVWKEWESSE
jgi:hypothetical protein